jgi:murein L,D-transpeptidase YafK
MQKRWILFLLLIAAAQPFVSCSQDSNSVWTELIAEAKKKRPLNEDIPLKKLVDSLNISSSSISMHIYKSDYLFQVRSGEQIIKEYKIVLGFDPKNDKLRQGDGCTPEGNFYIRAKYPHKDWNKFLWVNYPTKDSWKKHNAAKADGTITSRDKIGGEIGIHGVPDDMDYMIDLKENWTLGCISLKNKHVDEIYPFISTNKTLIQILK